jgi:hypothetical protein
MLVPFITPLRIPKDFASTKLLAYLKYRNTKNINERCSLALPSPGRLICRPINYLLKCKKKKYIWYTVYLHLLKLICICQFTLSPKDLKCTSFHCIKIIVKYSNVSFVVGDNSTSLYLFHTYSSYLLN